MTEAGSKSLVPLRLRRSAAFKEDIQALAKLPREVLQDVADAANSLAAGGDIGRSLHGASESTLRELAQSPRLVSALSVLKKEAVKYRVSKVEAAAALRDFLGDEHLEIGELSDAVLVPEEIHDEVLANEAFAAPPYFCMSSFTPILRESDGRLLPGLEWTIAFHDSHDEHRSFRFGLTARQARDLMADLEEAIERVSRLSPVELPDESEKKS